jgi:P2-related tail formation protein
MSLDVDTLFELLPAHLRVQDALLGAARKAELGDQSAKPPEDFGPLRTLISIIASEVARLETALDQLYDDHFIETCAEWVAPYIGDLVGARGAYDLGANGLSARALVANAIALRRAKGTAAAIEEVASAATLWNSVAVEFFQRAIIAQSMRLPRPARNGTPGLRDLTALRRVGSAFDTVSRSIEVRRIATAGGRWNLPNVGAFLWRVDARLRNWGEASRVAANQRDFFFHPLGINTRLWAAPANDPSINSRRTIAHVPRPIDRADMRRAIGDYWGSALAVRVRARGVPPDPARTIDPATVLVCDLPDAPVAPGFLHSPSPHATRIDPVRGRLILADDVTVGASDVVEVFYHEGAVLDFGAGCYERGDRIDNAIAGTDAVVVDSDDNVAAALTAAFAATPGFVRVDSNALHVVPGGAVALVADARIAIGAANGSAPVLHVQADFDFTGGGASGAEIILSGLTIAGGIRIGAGVRKLVLTDVTLVPGRDRNRAGSATVPAAPSLTIASDGCEVKITRSVLGPIVIEQDDVKLELVESVVVAGTATAAALSRAAGVDGDQVSMQHVTVIGCVTVGSVGEISDCILWGKAAQGASDPAFKAMRLQDGCVRFSALPPGAIAPRRYRCVPAGAVDIDAPAFMSVVWPGPNFVRLKAIAPRSITQGASDGGEMGIYGLLKQCAREINLVERLAEFTPFGMESGFFYEN